MKIFVTVGTTEFDDLITEMDKYASRTGQHIVFQVGHGGHYVPKMGKYYKTKPDLSTDLRSADIIISHGGGGTILEALALERRVVAVANPRMKAKHQDDLVDHLASEGYIIKGTPGKLEKALRSKKKLKPYQRPECTIHKKLKI